MAAFPLLKTNAVAQYPATKAVQFRNQALRFLDGGEQRYRDSAGPLRRWEIRLSALDERELAAIEAFFVDNQGASGAFTFTDPWDATEHANCSLQSDELLLESTAALQGRTAWIVVENRT